MSKILVSLVAVLSGIIGCEARRAAEVAKVSYVPFEVATYFPVTPGNIDEPGKRRTKTLPWSGTVMSLLKSQAEEATNPPTDRFDESLVRLKVALPNGEIWLVDKLGSVRLSHAGTVRILQLSPPALAELGSVLIEEFPEYKIDMKAIRERALSK